MTESKRLGGRRCADALLALVALGAALSVRPTVAQERLEAVRTAHVAREPIRQTTTQPATVHADFEARLHAKVSGYLKELKADIGDVVEKGQTLGVIDVPEMIESRAKHQAVIDKLRTEESRAKVLIAVAEAQVAADAAAIEQASSELAKAQAQLSADRSELQRFESLVKDKSVTQKLVDEARNRFEAAQAAVVSAKANVASAEAARRVSEARLESSKADVAVAQARTRVAKSELAELEALLQYATLRAPFDGVVTSRGVEPGDLVQNATSAAPNTRPLFTVAKIDKVRIRTAVPERDATFVDVGDEGRFRPQSLPKRVFHGKVTRLAHSLDRSTGTMLVELELPNSNRTLYPGMYGTATIVLEDRPDGLLLDADAVHYDGSGRSFVYVVDEADKIREVPVTTGWDNGVRIEIVKGLTGDERVVASQIGRLTTGQTVRVVDE